MREDPKATFEFYLALTLQALGDLRAANRNLDDAVAQSREAIRESLEALSEADRVLATRPTVL